MGVQNFDFAPEFFTIGSAQILYFCKKNFWTRRKFSDRLKFGVQGPLHLCCCATGVGVVWMSGGK